MKEINEMNIEELRALIAEKDSKLNDYEHNIEVLEGELQSAKERIDSVSTLWDMSHKNEVILQKKLDAVKSVCAAL